MRLERPDARRASRPKPIVSSPLLMTKTLSPSGMWSRTSGRCSSVCAASRPDTKSSSRASKLSSTSPSWSNTSEASSSLLSSADLRVFRHALIYLGLRCFVWVLQGGLIPDWTVLLPHKAAMLGNANSDESAFGTKAIMTAFGAWSEGQGRTGISAEGRAQRVMPDFSLPVAERSDPRIIQASPTRNSEAPSNSCWVDC